MRAQIQLIPCGGGGQIWPLLKIEVPDPQKWSKSGILIFLANFQVILSNFCFYGKVEKIIFGPLLYSQKQKICLILGDRAGGGSDLTTFENRSSRPPKMVQKWNFNFLNKFLANFKQLLFLWQCQKNHFLDNFCTTKDFPYTLYRVTVRGGGSDLTIFENRFSGPQKWSKKWFFGVLS